MNWNRQQENWSGVTGQPWRRLLENFSEIDGEMKAELSEKYVRAIAKIGFHFFLKYFPTFSRLEPELDEIKRFIYEGKATREVVRRVDEPFLKDLQQREFCR